MLKLCVSFYIFLHINPSYLRSSFGLMANIQINENKEKWSFLTWYIPVSKLTHYIVSTWTISIILSKSSIMSCFLAASD